MRGRAVVVGLLVGVLVAIAAAVFGIGSSAAHAAAPARLFVSAKEYSLILSRMKLRPGAARIQLYNAGEDAHDLRLQRVGSTRSLRVAETEPGKVTELSAVLRSGKWKLYCSLPGHARAGMRATLTVTR